MEKSHQNKEKKIWAHVHKENEANTFTMEVTQTSISDFGLFFFFNTSGTDVKLSTEGRPIKSTQQANCLIHYPK